MAGSVMDAWVSRCYNAIHPIYKSDRNYGIPEHWLAGLISVECSSINPVASRFEPGVYKSVQAAKKGLAAPNFPGFLTGKLGKYIKETKDEKLLKTLATSYGVGQIMGYHYFNHYGLQPEEYSRLSLPASIHYTLLLMSAWLPSTSTFPRLLRKWNTGSATGNTHDPKYVEKAVAASVAYEAYALGRKTPEK